MLVAVASRSCGIAAELPKVGHHSCRVFSLRIGVAEWRVALFCLLLPRPIFPLRRLQLHTPCPRIRVQQPIVTHLLRRGHDHGSPRASTLSAATRFLHSTLFFETRRGGGGGGGGGADTMNGTLRPLYLPRRRKD